MLTDHEKKVMEIFERLGALFKMRDLSLRFMRRGRVVDTKKSYIAGSASLNKRTITVDIYTPRFRKPKSLNGIIRVLTHEIAHYQKPPYHQRYKGHIIARQHYPKFYKQITKNLSKIKKDPILGQYFK